MSIVIDRDKCTGCGECLNVCPGNLIHQDENKIAYIKYPMDCWGCASCVKECDKQAIMYYLGEDIGGKGAYMFTINRCDELDFIIVSRGEEKVLTVNRKTANKY